MDRYSLNARIYPVILTYLPIVILGILFSFGFKDYVPFLTSLGLVGALSFLFSQLGRDRGKAKEPGLWTLWGGTPTIQILRWRNSHIDNSTKARYHNKLQLICPQNQPPTETFEQSNSSECDESYQAWTKFLLAKTRDTKVFSLLFSENISYGFRRNLWGLKPVAITVIILCIITPYLYYLNKFSSLDLRIYPKLFFLAEGLMIFILFFWIFIITKRWIKLAAFSYAERLLESTEHM